MKIEEQIKVLQQRRSRLDLDDAEQIREITDQIQHLFDEMNPDKRNNPFAVWLRSQLTDMDITTQVLGDWCVVGRVTVSHWINGHSIPQTKAWNELARIVSERTQKPLSEVLEKMSQTI